MQVANGGAMAVRAMRNHVQATIGGAIAVIRGSINVSAKNHDGVRFWGNRAVALPSNDKTIFIAGVCLCATLVRQHMHVMVHVEVIVCFASQHGSCNPALRESCLSL